MFHVAPVAQRNTPWNTYRLISIPRQSQAVTDLPNFCLKWISVFFFGVCSWFVLESRYILTLSNFCVVWGPRLGADQEEAVEETKSKTKNNCLVWGPRLGADQVEAEEETQ